MVLGNGGKNQSIAMPVYADPPQFSVTVKGQELGDVAIRKTSSDGVVANIEFTIENESGYSATDVTDSKGYLEFSR